MKRTHKVGHNFKDYTTPFPNEKAKRKPITN